MKFTNLTVNVLTFLVLIFIGSSCEKEKIVENERTFEMELEELDEFLTELESDGFDVDTTELGVYYIILKEGTGPYPSAGDTLYLEYLGFLPDGTEFDATRRYASGIWEFIYLYQDLPTGLNDGLALMNKGTQLDIMIPSHLAYGSEGTAQVPPFTTVIYRATMHDIKFSTE